MLLPTVSSLPAEKVAAGALDRAGRHAGRGHNSTMSNTPSALVMNRALPPVLASRKNTPPPALVVMVASPAVLFWRNWVEPAKLLVIVAFPAVELSRKMVLPNSGPPLPPLVMVALPAVLVSANWVKPSWFVMLALPRGAVVEEVEQAERGRARAGVGDRRVRRPCCCRRTG